MLAVIVYVRLLPAVTGSGESIFATDKSVDVATVLVVVPVLLLVLGSGTGELAVAEFAMRVPLVVFAFTFTTSVNVIDAPTPVVVPNPVAVTFPVPPTAGVVDVHPAGAEKETKVVFAGTASVIEMFDAGDGPPLLTWIA